LFAVISSDLTFFFAKVPFGAATLPITPRTYRRIMIEALGSPRLPACACPRAARKEPMPATLTRGLSVSILLSLLGACAADVVDEETLDLEGQEEALLDDEELVGRRPPVEGTPLPAFRPPVEGTPLPARRPVEGTPLPARHLDGTPLPAGPETQAVTPICDAYWTCLSKCSTTSIKAWNLCKGICTDLCSEE
jgi:hypothetical protein